MPDLWWLDFSHNSISDISALNNLTGLQLLYLSDNQISDITALTNLTALQDLHLDNNQIGDISALVANTGLGAGDTIDLTYNQLDISPGSQNMTDIDTLIGRGATVY